MNSHRAARERERLVALLRREGIRDEHVLTAIAAVPRHEFVSDEVADSAYEDMPLPIGYGQTISQPYIVALMTELLRLQAGDRVLEIGTGCGYQAAVLASMGCEVFSLERVSSLARLAEARLQRLGYAVSMRMGDGFAGWPEAAPFDAIIVTAAPSQVPETLQQQLAPGGRMVVPVGGRDEVHALTVVERLADGALRSSVVAPVRFVPMVPGAD